MNIDIKTILLKKVLPRGWWICLVATLISHIALLGAGASAVQALDSAAARISSVATRTVATNVQHALPALKNTLYALIALVSVPPFSSPPKLFSSSNLILTPSLNRHSQTSSPP